MLSIIRSAVRAACLSCLQMDGLHFSSETAQIALRLHAIHSPALCQRASLQNVSYLQATLTSQSAEYTNFCRPRCYVLLALDAIDQAKGHATYSQI